MLVSSTTSRSASISSLVGPCPGIQPSAEWIVDASIPVDSAIRRAARPVGATSATDARCALAAAQISRIVAVLPVPGPPVTIDIRDANAASTAAHCSGAGMRSAAAGGAAAGGGRRTRRGGGAAADGARRRTGRGGGRGAAARGRGRGAGPAAWPAPGPARRRAGGGSSRPARPPARRSAGGRPRRRPRRSRGGSGRRRTCPAAARRPVPGPPSSFGGAGREVGHRQAGRAVALGLAEHVDDRGPHAADAVARDARRARDRVRDREPDAEHARQLVGAAAHDVVRAVAVLGRDPRHQPGEPVRREQEVQRAGGAQAVPRADRLVGPLRVQPRGPERARRVLVDREQHVVAVALQQPRRPPDADVLDAPQVGDQRLVARGRHRLGDPHLDLQAEALVVGPHALDPHPLALLEVRERPDEHDVVALAIGVDDGEAGVLGREAQPPHHHLVRERRPGLAVDHPRRPYNALRAYPTRTRVSVQLRRSDVTGTTSRDDWSNQCDAARARSTRGCAPTSSAGATRPGTRCPPSARSARSSTPAGTRSARRSSGCSRAGWSRSARAARRACATGATTAGWSCCWRVSCRRRCRRGGPRWRCGRASAPTRRGAVRARADVALQGADQRARGAAGRARGPRGAATRTTRCMWDLIVDGADNIAYRLALTTLLSRGDIVSVGRRRGAGRARGRGRDHRAGGGDRGGRRGGRARDARATCWSARS